MERVEIDRRVRWLDKLFKEAMRTDRFIPSDKPKSLQAFWVEIKKDWMAYGWDTTSKVRIKPSQKQQDRYDLAWRLGLMLPEDERYLVWRVALTNRQSNRGPQWSKIGRELRKARRTIKNEYYAALSLLAKKVEALD